MYDIIKFMENKKEIVDLKEYEFLIDLDSIKDYSDANTIFLNKSVAEALLLAKKQLPKSYNFIIKDGLRTYEIQKKIVEITEKEFKISHPDNWEELLNKYTGGYKDLKETKISFMNHLSGNAVDLSITKNKEEIDMGDVDLSDRDKIAFFDDKKDLNSKDQNIKNNRELLRKILGDAGFVPYPLEWWHWGYRGKK